MPAAATAKDVSAAAGKDTAAPATGQFAAVLQQRSETQDRPVPAKRTDAQDRPGTGKRAEMRGQGRKDEAKVDLGEGSKTGLLGGASPVLVNSAAALPMAAAADAEAAVGVGPEVGFAARVGASGDAGGEPVVASGREAKAAGSETTGDPAGPETKDGTVVQDASGAEAKDGMAADPKNASVVTGDAAVASTVPANTVSGWPPKPESDAVAAVPEGLLTGMGAMAGAAPVSGSDVVADRAAVAASAGSARQQGSALKAMQGKAFGGERHLGVGGPTASVLGQDGLEKSGSGAVGQTRLSGEIGRGQNEVRPVGKGVGEAADTAGRDGSVSDGSGSGPAQPVPTTAAPVQAVPAAMLPITAVPVEAPRSVAVSDRGVAAGSGDGAGLGSAGAGLAGANAASVVAEAAPLTSVGAARLLKSVAGSELRVGTQSADLGAVTIRTVLGREQMQAHISFENERMGSALSAHLLGGSLEDRLGQSLGVRASVTLSAGADAGTGQSGQEAARDAMTGQAGSGNGSSREGSGRNAAQMALGNFGGYGSSGAGSSVSRSMQSGGTAVMEGRLDIRV